MNRRPPLLAALLAGLVPGLACAAAPAASAPAASRTAAAAPVEKASEVDMEFLEFLGSLDAEEEGWQEYLEERPIRTTAAKPAGKQPAATEPEGKQDKAK